MRLSTFCGLHRDTEHYSMSQVCVSGIQDHPKVSEKMAEYITVLLFCGILSLHLSLASESKPTISLKAQLYPVAYLVDGFVSINDYLLHVRFFVYMSSILEFTDFLHSDIPKSTTLLISGIYVMCSQDLRWVNLKWYLDTWGHQNVKRPHIETKTKRLYLNIPRWIPEFNFLNCLSRKSLV
jgi:hypothetical protein